MANAKRGEVALSAEGGEVILRFTTDALCALEDEMNMGVAEIGRQLASGDGLRISSARQFVRVAMLDHQPDATLKSAGELMDSVGIVNALNAAASAFQKAFPQEGEDPDAGQGGAASGDARPPLGPGGTG